MNWKSAERVPLIYYLILNLITYFKIMYIFLVHSLLFRNLLCNAAGWPLTSLHAIQIQ